MVLINVLQFYLFTENKGHLINYKVTCTKQNIANYCDLRGRIKGTARALYPVFVERALWPILSGHKAR